MQVSKDIIARTIPYSLSWSATWTSLLVLGDSTSVGVGADHPEESIAGRLTEYLGATYVEHHGVSGAIVADIPGQMEKIEKKEYDTILLQIWANDMTGFHDLDEVATEYESIIEWLPKHKTLVVTSCGNLGGARIFPFPLTYIYEYVSKKYHAKLSEIVSRNGGLYIDLFEERSMDPFVQSPEIYLAADSFHPSGAGYGLWFNKVKARLEKNMK